MLFAGVESIRDAIAIYKTTSSVSLVDECPSGYNGQKVLLK